MTDQTILVADDDEMIVDALRYQLEKEGYGVLVAHDGAQALALAQSRKPDLLLLDVMMPKMQGWEVCREIRRESTVPILMLTARGEEMDRVLGLELGADDYIVKPFAFRELLARIRANLRRVSFQAAHLLSKPTDRLSTSAASKSTSAAILWRAAARPSRFPSGSTICWWPCKRRTVR